MRPLVKCGPLSATRTRSGPVGAVYLAAEQPGGTLGTGPLQKDAVAVTLHSARSCDMAVSHLEDWIACADPIDRKTLDRRATLQTRKDRKYVLSPDLLVAVLGRLAEPVQVLETDAQRWFSYRSDYFDTPTFASYRSSAYRRPTRFKVRARTYLDTGTVMIEVKTKSRRGLTVKHRTHFHGSGESLLKHVRRFAADVNESASAADALQPSFVTTYHRATLLLPQSSVRVTIDAHYLGVAGCLGVGGSLSVDRRLGVGGSDGVGGNLEFAHQPASTHLGGEIIVETKSAGRPSAVDRALWQARCRPTRISKYTTGLAALRPDLPSNRWHRTLDRHFEVTRP